MTGTSSPEFVITSAKIITDLAKNDNELAPDFQKVLNEETKNSFVTQDNHLTMSPGRTKDYHS
jgi:hypothetical protein